ncbi:unnamed protein product [Effrenium voratum]|uniref:Ion transport domain-containing protein n=1 Tax=Effrenium voratum TaxID=2562239 RepID=A0AA36JHX0_9DINO|nr:unnamed protein product [Effrenium voratum]
MAPVALDSLTDYTVAEELDRARKEALEGHSTPPAMMMRETEKLELPDLEGLEGRLEQQHKDVIDRLLTQEQLLVQICSSILLPAKRKVARIDERKIDESQGVLSSGFREVGHNNSNASATESQMPRHKASKVSLSFTPKLFSTFSRFDLNLQQAAAQADAQLNRQRFAASRGGTEDIEKRFLGPLVQHPAFDLFFGLVVVTNAVFIGIEVQEQIRTGDHTNELLSTVSYFYTVVFLVELLVRFFAYGIWHFIWSEDWTWNLLDSIIVLSSVTEIILQFLSVSSGTSMHGIAGLKAFRIIRMVRLFKTVRLMRVFRFVMALRTLVSSIFHTLKSLFWALVLLVLIVYVFALLFAQAMNDHRNDAGGIQLTVAELEARERYFGSVVDTMLSLFSSIAGGVSWEEVLAPLKAVSSFWVVCFLFYISFTYFAVLNVVTAVFCQSAIEGAQNDHITAVQSVLADKEAHLQKVRELFNQLGAGEDAPITFSVFNEKIHTEAVREYFTSLGLDIWDAWTFFKLLDADGGGEVEAEEFLLGCLRLRGPATAIDIGRLMHDQNWLIRSQGRFQTYMEAEIRQLKSLLTKSGF